MIPFSKRENNAGQTILIIAPTGHGKNILLINLIKQHLSNEFILLFSDSAKEAVDNNDVWYDGKIFETAKLKEIMTNLHEKKYIEPIYLIIDDPSMEQKTINYLSQMVRKIRHSKISIIILFQAYTKEISPNIRGNSRLIYFSSTCGRVLLENIYDSLNLHDTKKDFIEGIHKIAEKYRFVFVDKETAEIKHFKPELIKYHYKFDPKRKLKYFNQSDKKNSPK